MEARLESAIVRYLAVAHFGRGRGEFQAAAAPARWRDAARAVLQAQAQRRSGLWRDLRSNPLAASRLAAVLEDLLSATLRSLYPDAASHFG